MVSKRLLILLVFSAVAILADDVPQDEVVPSSDEDNPKPEHPIIIDDHAKPNVSQDDVINHHGVEAGIQILGSSVAPMSPTFCFQCNSASYIDGDACTGSNLDQFYRECPKDDGRIYTRCRIISQTVNGNSRIIRSCASAGTREGEHCVDRTGTHSIKVRYCECSNANLERGVLACNKAPAFTTSLTMTSFVLFIAVLIWRGTV